MCDFSNKINEIAGQTLSVGETKKTTTTKTLKLPLENNPRLLEREALANPIEVRFAKAKKEISDVGQSSLRQARLKHLVKVIAEPKTAQNNYNKFVKKLAEERKNKQQQGEDKTR